MSQTLALIIATVAGMFSILTVLLNWQFTKRNMSHQGFTQFEEKRYQNILDLYVHTYELIERAMAGQIMSGPVPTQSEFSANSAKMRLLAPTLVYNKYFDVTALVEKWSALDSKAKPRKTKIGDQTITFIQSPDPTAKYKEPAEKAFKQMHEGILELTDLMRTDLNSHIPHHSSHLRRLDQ